ncbi:hypothetical protein EAG_09470 [Camponotus floridanus]|uniref:Uncharacterized protein n=1 Tax=Camponotus floridanus TaxID=104421 RepID=E1ZYL3_CAMFO|nr:hypothetical protein EAG_09470 [Camponotus floridanus]
MIRLGNEAQKRKVMEMKKNLRRRKERILEDWTWKERKMSWRLEEIARKEMGKRRRIWVGYGVIRIEQWWRWDEIEEVLVDGRGKIREKEGGNLEEQWREMEKRIKETLEDVES